MTGEVRNVSAFIPPSLGCLGHAIPVLDFLIFNAPPEQPAKARQTEGKAHVVLGYVSVRYL